MAGPLKELFARFGFDFDTKELDRGNAAVKGVSQAVANFGAMLTGPALATGITAFVSRMVESGQELADTATALRTTASELTEWRLVAESAGVPVEHMNNALGSLSANLRAAEQRNGDAVYSFRRLGVSIRDGSGAMRSTADVMTDVGAAIARIENPVLRARLATRHFGDAGRYMVPIFEQGASAIERVRSEVRDFAGADLDEFSRASQEVRGEQARMRLAFQGVATSIALQLLPYFRMGMNAVTEATRLFKQIATDSTGVQTAIQALSVLFVASMLRMGASAVAAFAPALVAIAPYALALAGVLFIVDELNALFGGGRSLIGEWIDSFAGAGASRAFVDDVRYGVELLTESLSRALDWTVRMFESIPNVADTAVAGFMGAIRPIFATLARIPGLAAATRSTLGVDLDELARGAPPTPRTQRAATRGVGGPTEAQLEADRATGRTSVRGVAGAVRATAAGVNQARSDVRVATNVGGITVNVNTGNPAEVAQALSAGLEEQTEQAVNALNRRMVPRIQRSTLP